MPNVEGEKLIRPIPKSFKAPEKHNPDKRSQIQMLEKKTTMRKPKRRLVAPVTGGGPASFEEAC